MAIERRLTEIAGPVGGRLHTARSRNDQVVTDLAMYTRERVAEHRDALTRADGCAAGARGGAHRLADARLHPPAARAAGLPRPPPAGLLLDARSATARASRSPSASPGACRSARARWRASTSTPTGELLARELGFAGVAPNSIDAVSGRDFVLDYLAAAATCATHLSRLGAELVLWSSAEFGFCELPDAWSSGSSIMPQKKNPDAAELLRAKAPRVVGHLAAFHGVMHALPLTYNKDLQEDKEHLFDAVDTLELTLAAATGMIAGVSFDRERMREAAADELIAATDVADLLVRLGMPFREAHGVVAGLVRTALDAGKPLSSLTAEELALHSETLAAHHAEYQRVLAQSSWLESKVSEGGTSLARVREQIALARAALDDGRFRLRSTIAPSWRSRAS